LRVQQAFEPILHDFFNMLVQEPMRYRMEQTGFMKTPPRWALSRLLPRNRYGDSPLWRYYLTINARSL
jgi:hypothetical protein